MERRLLAAALLAALTATVAAAAPRHGLSAFGELKYGADFKHFAYVNADAPKGGRLALVGNSAVNTFDSFNGFILRGNSPEGLGLLFDSLMARAMDEPDAMYGLVAHAVDLAPDRSAVTFFLRPEAVFADGTPVTAGDAVFSFEILKEKGHPSFGVLLRDVVAAVAVDARTVRYDLAGQASRDLPLTIAGLPILSKAYYATRKFDETSLDIPLGSGPYTIGDFRQGSQITFKRRPDYWGRELPVNRGRYNFDEIRYELFRERTAALEALKAGSYDLREEFTARDWVTGYDVPAVREGRLVRVTLPDENPSGAQGYFLNTRRASLADSRVRRALALAFDFEWANKNLFYDLYTRTESYFENSDMKASGPPAPAELALLEPYRAELPEEVFGEAIRAPVSDGTKKDRRMLAEASRLLNAAGWQVRDGKRMNARGETLELEFLITDQSSERIVTPYIESLVAIGVKATARRVDPAQFQERLKRYDFDIVISRFILRLSPGVELRNFFSTGAAEQSGSQNLAGIRSKAVDGLIEKVVAAASRAELVTATRALDRVLRAGHYWVPHWYKASHNVAYWDKFGRPAVKPRYDRGIIDTWWYDADKAARLRTTN
jgi:microcin C transport system substrate-binding protein